MNLSNSSQSKFHPSILIICCLLSSCGYNWGPGSRSLPGGYKKVFVEIFKNRTYELGAEFDFTQALKTKLEQSGFIKVTKKKEAEIIITGDIINVTNLDSGSQPTFFKVDYERKQAYPYKAPMFTIYKMEISANIKVTRANDKKVLWQSLVKGGKTYRGSLLTRQGLRSSNVLYNKSRREQTIKIIAEDMMEEAFDLMAEDF